ncbi:MAG: hypothetical protein LPK20_04620 [Halomonas sp.]|jgi:hypothetical protein|uniref:Uncharacterized protein n=1 Tax=Billgrantia tianxiuensis TaxID=2497861 RepID=A0A6I6SMB3_9GAMM|nr:MULTISPECIES: hypothetical protein [Halomonas]MCE8032505.1 hypothetical protein [Halomonas sp. MCCC 1A11057]MDX5432837.1 hypothetical protein [Halomonas sp.]MDX5502542.1 hypothetical protein [Halomonas sp.]QHC49544.1 hypothetical protein EKK97_07840 [Halomonas tianxiuensis]
MTEIVIWLIAFALILFFSIKMWETTVSAGLNKVVPRVIKSGDDNRWVWSVALAVLGATTLVRPIDMLLTVIVLAILALVIKKVTGWAMGRANFH